MFKIIPLFIIILIHIYAAESAYIQKISEKGKKVADILCKKDIYKIDISGDTNSTVKKIEQSNLCRYIDRDRAVALIAYLKHKKTYNAKKEFKSIDVPKDAKCPVCGMFVYKYPKWSAEIIVDGKSYYFDGVKDMMKFYIFDGDFPYDRKKIEKILVQDFYTLHAIDAKKAWYVAGSDIYGPMGNELIPFADKESAEEFKEEHKGEKILKFKDITPSLVLGLDGIEFDDNAE